MVDLVKWNSSVKDYHSTNDIKKKNEILIEPIRTGK